MEGILNGRGDLDDKRSDAQGHRGPSSSAGPSACGAAKQNLLKNLERAKDQLPKLHGADPEMVVQACIFEIVTHPGGAGARPGMGVQGHGPAGPRRGTSLRDMIYAGRQGDEPVGAQWFRARREPAGTKLWFYFLAASYIDVGCEAIHFGQVELMNGNDRDLRPLHRDPSADSVLRPGHARRPHAHQRRPRPSGGLVRDGKLLFRLHSFPLRIKEVRDRPRRRS